jgi:hypothetical protein
MKIIQISQFKNYKITSKKSHSSRAFQKQQELAPISLKFKFLFYWIFFEKIVQYSITLAP